MNIRNFVMDRPSPNDIISGTDSTAWVIDKKMLERLTKENSDIAICVQKILLGHLAYYENRLLQMSTPSNASDRYSWVAEWHPGLLREVPVKRIASFLGVTVQYMSRIRRQLLGI